MADYTPIYTPLNLGEIDERYAGQSLPILRNPTRKFRREFIASVGETFADNLAFILGVERDKLNEILDGLEDAMVRYLFAGSWDEKGVAVWPHMYKVWDNYADEQAKKYSTPSAQSR